MSDSQLVVCPVCASINRVPGAKIGAAPNCGRCSMPLFQGQPVADLTAARTESQLKSMLDQLLAKLPIEANPGGAEAAPDIAPLLTMAEDVLSAGDGARAAGIFQQINQYALDQNGIKMQQRQVGRQINLERSSLKHNSAGTDSAPHDFFQRLPLPVQLHRA